MISLERPGVACACHRRARRISWAAAALAALVLLGRAAHAAAPAPLPIGYIELTDDPRYDEKLAYAGLMLALGGRPYSGAQLGLEDAQIIGQAANFVISLDKAEAPDAASLVAAIEKLRKTDNVHFFLIDLPDALVEAVGKATRGQDVLLFNVSATGSALRAEACEPQVMHIAPSQAMLSDAMAQFLVSKKWRNVLVLEGPRPEDKLITAALARSAKRFGLKIVDTRKFVLSEDPRERDENNLALLTGDADYDVVFVADTEGEFARYVPYETQAPRPVVGSAGLAAVSWHWSWERDGAPQLTRRFERLTHRNMQSADWAAWAGVRILAEAALRSGSTDFAKMTAYLKSDKLTFDGYLGPPLNFRPWNNQLRQPVLLATSNWVVDEAPIKGFLHPTNNLDTLGFDRPDSRCKF